MESFSAITMDTLFSLMQAPLVIPRTMWRNSGDLLGDCNLATDHNFTQLIVEGDSQIIINLLSRLLNGADPERISPSWRLSHGLKTITDLLQPNQAVIPAHIRRSANQVADELANLGVNWDGPELLCKTSLTPDHPILQQCIRKAGEVDKPPDGVIVPTTWRTEGERRSQQGSEPCDQLVPTTADST
jgi:hypothetical protein